MQDSSDFPISSPPHKALITNNLTITMPLLFGVFSLSHHLLTGLCPSVTNANTMRILLLTLLIAATALAQEKAPAPQQSPAQGPPPKNLTKHPDGHFSANSEPKDVESFEVRAVVAGDTLSGISRDILKDGKLWPQI